MKTTKVSQHIVSVLFLLSIGCGSQLKDKASFLASSDFSEPAEMTCSSLVSTKGVYGVDNRKDWKDVKEESLKLWAKATVALLPKSLGGNLTEIFGDTLEQAFNVCKDEPFAKQPTFAFCSGFLVGKDIVVTAGHCITSQNDCNTTEFVFDYAIEDNNTLFPRVSQQKIYSCKKIIGHESGGTRDYAIVQLDRPVEDRKFLPIRRQGSAQVGSPLVMIGHPSGLPSKIARGGRVLGYNQWMVTDLDAFAGNSGSLVMNETTGLVEGILVSGDGDYTLTNQHCYTTKKCSPSTCTGEMVFPISQIAASIPVPSAGDVLPTCK